jgi:lysophospholipase L1-like esterase
MDMRLIFIGDSIVAGTGDDECRGWVGRVGTAARRAGVDHTPYNLGIGGDTAGDVLARWEQEVTRRLNPEIENRLAIQVGVNDARDGVERPADDSVADLGAFIDGARAAGFEPLVVGPIPTAQPAESERIGALSERFAGLCAERGAAFIEVHAALRDNGVFMASVAGDGYHPDADGYAEIAQVVLHNGWWEWLARGGDRP